jgi:hypothetical protein
MTHKGQKQVELKQLGIFRTLTRDFPDGIVDISESPDFLVKGSTSTIGIELTSIVLQTPASRKPLQAQESECQLLLDRARSMCENKILPPLNVSVFFGTNTKFNKGNRERYASILVEYIESKIPSANGSCRHENDYVNLNQFPEEFHSITISRYDFLTSTFLNMFGTGWVQEDFSTELQNVINNKDALLPKYKPCDSYWLIVVAEWTAPSSFFTPSEQTLSVLYRISSAEWSALTTRFTGCDSSVTWLATTWRKEKAAFQPRCRSSQTIATYSISWREHQY